MAEKFTKEFDIEKNNKSKVFILKFYYMFIKRRLTIMKKVVNLIATILVIVGGLNWGLVGALNYDVVDAVFGAASIAARVIYILVGLGALWMLFTSLKKK